MEKLYETIEKYYTENGKENFLIDLEDQRSGILLLIFTDGKLFHRKKNARSLEIIENWPMKAWMDFRLEDFWDETINLPLMKGIKVFSANSKGIKQVINIMLSERGKNDQVYENWYRERWLPSKNGKNSKISIEYHLEETLLWAEACSMMQPTPIGLVDALRRKFFKHLPPEAIEYLFTLPNTTWTKSGVKFSNSVLKHLKNGFYKRNSKEIKNKILSFILEQIEIAKPDVKKNSLAYLSWEAIKVPIAIKVGYGDSPKRAIELLKTPLCGSLLENIGSINIPFRLRNGNETKYFSKIYSNFFLKYNIEEAQARIDLKLNENHLNHANVKMKIIGFVFLGLFLCLVIRSAYLQIIFGPVLAEKASEQYEKTINTRGERGNIYDRNMSLVASTTDALSIAAYPRKIDDPIGTAKAIAPLVNMEWSKIKEKLSSNRSFVWIERQASPNSAKAIMDLGLKGLFTLPEHSRYYPNRTMAAQVIGFTGIDGNGLEGIEYLFDGELSGGQVIGTFIKDSFGSGFDPNDEKMAKFRGDNVILTIDRVIQNITETAVQKAVEKHQAKSGIAVVMEPSTGDVLALANVPLFNPNNFGGFKAEVRRNRAVTDFFEPGNIMIVFGVATALEYGNNTPNSVFYCENGNYKIGEATIHDIQKHGWLSIQRIVKYSSNIGAAKIAEMIGGETFFYTLHNFGFGQATGIDCPGETKGFLMPNKEWSPLDLATISFGHSISVSAIQLASAIAAIANEGMLMKPRIILKVTDNNNQVKRSFEPQQIRRAVSPETALLVAKMMQTVLTEGGTGVEAALDGYEACGKTGTAQKVGKNGIYEDDLYVASFAGFTPVKNPRIAIIVVIDEPHGNYQGGIVAAPVFKEIAIKSLGYLSR